MKGGRKGEKKAKNCRIRKEKEGTRSQGQSKAKNCRVKKIRTGKKGTRKERKRAKKDFSSDRQDLQCSKTNKTRYSSPINPYS